MKKILICDDEYDVIVLTKLLLEKHGYAVEGVESGEECIEKIKKQKFDLLLLDLMLPKMSGFEVIEIIRNKEKQFIPCFFFTARFNFEDVIEKALRFSCDYISKFRVEEVLSCKIKTLFAELEKFEKTIKEIKTKSYIIGKEYERAVTEHVILCSLLQTLEELIENIEKGKILNNNQLIFLHSTREKIEEKISIINQKIDRILTLKSRGRI